MRTTSETPPRERPPLAAGDPAWNLVVTVAAEETGGWVIMAEEFRTDLAWT